MEAKLLKDGKFTLIQKDGHTDAASVMKSCKTIISHCEMIMNNLTDPEANLPTWFTNKIAIIIG